MTFTELLKRVLSIRFSKGAKADGAYNHNHARTSHKFSLVNGDINSVYIYCEILEHVTVGDTKALLLRIVDKVRKKRGTVHQTFNPILYVPLQKKNFDTVKVNIMTDGGRPVFCPIRKIVHRSKIWWLVLGVIKNTPIAISVICHSDIARTMKRKPYCCDASCHMYKDYYNSCQVGGLMPVFVGSRQQQGHGLGSVSGGIFRRSLSHS